MGTMSAIEKAFTKKRVGPRFSFLVDAEIVLGDGTSIPTQLDEVSLRGCYLDTLEPIPVGTRFLLKIGKGRKALKSKEKSSTRTQEAASEFLVRALYSRTCLRRSAPRLTYGSANSPVSVSQEVSAKFKKADK
jgi:hypothetical protein